MSSALPGMRIVLAGGSGLIGRSLGRGLAAAGARPVYLSRSAPRAGGEAGGEWLRWDPADPVGTSRLLEGADGVVNLAGESIATGRWSPARKAALRSSRLTTTAVLTEALGLLANPRVVFVQASAVGFYGDGGERVLDERSPSGQGFLPDLVQDWERASAPLEGVPGVRRVVTRLAPVWTTLGGALPPLVCPFRLGLGGRLGSGRQWTPWIHLDDAVAALVRLLCDPRAEGVYNLAAPEPLPNLDLARLLGRILRRPSRLPLPVPLLRLALGAMADELLLVSQRVIPSRLEELGFAFTYPTAEMALHSLLGKEPGG